MNPARHACAGRGPALVISALMALFQAGCGAGDVTKPSSGTSEGDQATAHVAPDVALSLSFPVTPPGPVTLRIFDVEGHPVRIITKSFGTGTHELTWDGRNDDGFPVGSSVYLYQLALPGGDVMVGRFVYAR